jgi:hypothetical protein
MSGAQFRMNRVATSLAKVALVLVVLWTSAGRASAADNVVVQWNKATVDAIRNTKTPPPIASRAFAMTQTAMFDAWAAYDSVALSTRLGGALRRPETERETPNKEKAISFAAYRVLVDLFPTQTPLFDALMSSLGYDPSDLSLDTTSPSE